MENLNKDYDISYLSNVIEYNKSKYLAFKNQDKNFIVNKEYEKVLNARYQKVSRIKRRFLFLFTRFKYIWFCTFTFDDNYINKCDRTKRDLIKDVINNYDFKYILNIDYGKKTEREHYHCILATNYDFDIDEYIKSIYPCLSKSILCNFGIDDFKKISKYINKLTNHCIKSTTKRQRLVYNFKGYDSICSTRKDVSLMYFLDYDFFFNDETIFYKNDTLLDKGVITGKNL